MAEDFSIDEVVSGQDKGNQLKSKSVPYIKALHDNLVEAYGADQVPDEVTFGKKIVSDDKYLKNIHENLVEAYGADQVPEFSIFTDKVKKKDGTISSVTTEKSISRTGLPLQGFNEKQIERLKTGVTPSVPKTKTVVSKETIIPTNLPEIKQEARKKIEVENFGKSVLEKERIGQEAVKNTIDIRKKNPNVLESTAIPASGWSEEKEKNRLVQGLNTGEYQVGVSEKTGKPIIQRVVNEGAWVNFKKTLDEDYYTSLENEILPTLPREDKLKWLNSELGQEDQYLPKVQKGWEATIGREAARLGVPLLKAGVKGIETVLLQTVAPFIGTAAQAKKAGSVFSFMQDMAGAGYSNNLKRTYKSLLDQGYREDEALDKAENAANMGAAIGSGTGFAMGVGLNELSGEFKSAIQDIEPQSFIKSLKHIGGETVKQGAVAGTSSIGTDIAAKSQGLKITPDEILENSKNNAEAMAALTAGLGLSATAAGRLIASKNTAAAVQALGIVTGVIKVPKPIEAQAKGVVTQMPPEVIQNVFKQAESEGVIPEGSTEKIMSDLNKYDQTKTQVPQDVPQEMKASLQGIQEKINALEESKKKLDKSYHGYMDTQIEALRQKAKNIVETGDVFKNETDELGNPIDNPESNIEQKDITVGEMLDRTGTYNGEKGNFYQDGQTVVFKVEGQPKEYEIGNIEEIQNAPAADFGIKNEESVVSFDQDKNITVRGKTYLNKYSDSLQAINKDKEGNIVSVNLESPDGQKRTFRGNIAEDIAYQLNLAKKAETAEPLEPAKIEPLSEIKEFKVGYAPFREGKITDISQASKAFDNTAFQNWKKMSNTFAKNIGLEVVSDPNTVGKYGATSELGEVSSTPIVKGTDQQVELFAALMGSLAPEGQHSVMMNKYDLNGKDFEHIFTFANKEAAYDFYKNAGKYGIEDLSLTPDNNSVMFIVSDKKGFDLKNLINDYERQITEHEENAINTRFLSQGEYSRILDEHGNKIGEQYPQEYRENIADAIKLAKERSRRLSSDYGEKSEQAQVEAAKAVADYVAKNKEELGLPDVQETKVSKVNPELADQIQKAYDKLPVDDSKNPEVASAYNKAIQEIDKQFEYLTKDLGIKVEFIKDDPYPNSDAMFEDVVNNKRLKIFQGGEPHPFLGESSKDQNGFTANEKLRAVHDYFGHFVNRNQFGKVGEEAAWVDHSKMFSPEAQRAVSTETRGQNSWVNFSGANKEAIAKMQKGNELIKQGQVAEGNKLIQEGQSEFKFAEQKVALMPKELTDWRIYEQKGGAKPKEVAEVETAEVAIERTPQEQALLDEYNRQVSEAGKSKKVQENARKTIIDANFDSIVEDLKNKNKIKIEC